MHYKESTQATKWQLSSQHELNLLRERANRRARDILSRENEVGEGNQSSGGGSDGGNGGASTGEGGANQGNDERENDGNEKNVSMGSIPLEAYSFSATRGTVPKVLDDDDEDDDGEIAQDPTTDPNFGPTHSSTHRGSYPLLTPSDEALLLTFYCSKIPLLVGPHATLHRCRRDAKVAATASLLFRRFYLSNSVMIHDPKTILVAAAFLASKVEDAMLDVRYLEMGTKEMNAPVPMMEILDAEVKLLKGCDFDLMVFHPYKTVLSYTEDLRTYLKSDKGKGLALFGGGGDVEAGAGERQVVGEDLRPMHDAARKIVDDVIVSDIPLMFGPGEVGLAALMVANEELGGVGTGAQGESLVPRINIMGYVRSRFQDANETELKVDAAAMDAVASRVSKLCHLIRGLKEGKYGCGNHNVDMERLKGVHKKLKKCRAWGPVPTSSKDKDGKKGEKKKKKKRKADEVSR